MTSTRAPKSVLSHYEIQGVPIEKVSTFKYLGVNLSSDLTWNEHINIVTSRTSKTLGFVRRNLYLANSSTELLAYTTLVRSKIEYASIIWNPHKSYLVDQLELIQSKAARFITKKYSRNYSIADIKHSLSLPSLQKRRLLALLSHFHTFSHILS